jgi:uncharacterized protein (TIGR03083 family)
MPESATLSAVTVSTDSTGAGQNELARDALRSQRQRFAVLLRGLDDDAWTAQSRCAEWSVHEVVRHLCDATLKTTALLRGELPEDVGTADMDPRTTPVAWLARSSGERPHDTLAVFEDATAELLDEVDRHARASTDAEIPWLYASVPWSIAVLHVFWDAWIHERDILEPLRRQPESPAIESRAAATYGLTMACVPVIFGSAPLDELVVLAGDGGGRFSLEVREGNGRQIDVVGFRGAGKVTITVVGGDDGDGGPLHGTLVDVVDSLIGRGPELTEVLHGPTERVERLGMLRAFMLLPAS